MICLLQGTIEHHGVGFVILVRDGIGYKINLPESAAHEVKGEVTLYTHEVIREDQRELFGFLSLEALELFWRLIGVSGIGPKGSQKIVFAAPVSVVKERIMIGDLDFLTNVPGIGKKTAQKIFLELKGTLAEETTGPTADQDALEALFGLGYTRVQAERALADVEGTTTEERVRAALKRLGR